MRTSSTSSPAGIGSSAARHSSRSPRRRPPRSRSRSAGRSRSGCVSRSRRSGWPGGARRGVASRGRSAIVLSPQYSPLLMGGYARAIEEARATLGDVAPDVRRRRMARRTGVRRRARASVDEALGRLPSDERESVRVLMTAHSLPRRVAEQEPDYLAQLRATAEAVAASSRTVRREWTFCWQSAGHEPGEWMKPDFADLMPRDRRRRWALGPRGPGPVPRRPPRDPVRHRRRRPRAGRACGLAFHRIESLNLIGV